MRRLVLSARFKKNLKDFLRKPPELTKIFEDKIYLLQHDPHAASLKTHKLTGKLKNYWALSITYDYRLVFLWITVRFTYSPLVHMMRSTKNEKSWWTILEEVRTFWLSSTEIVNIPELKPIPV